MPKKGTQYLELRSLLVKQGMGQEDLGIATGLGARNISNRLCGKAPWRLDEVYKVCAILDIPHNQIPIYFPPQQPPQAGRRRTA